MTTHPENVQQIDRLVRFWPQANLTDDAVLAYGEAVAGKDPRDVRTATDRLIRGTVERNHEYIPPPAQLAFQIDRARNERLDDEARNRPRLASPLPPSADEMAQRRALVAKMRGTEGTLLKRMPRDMVITPAEHEEAKRKAIAEAASLERTKPITEAAALVDNKGRVTDPHHPAFDAIKAENARVPPLSDESRALSGLPPQDQGQQAA